MVLSKEALDLIRVYRIPFSTNVERVALASDVVRLTRGTTTRVIVNDRLDVALFAALGIFGTAAQACTIVQDAGQHLLM